MKHGTLSGYNYHECRCDLCREAKRAWSHSWRERNPARHKAALASRRHRYAGTCVDCGAPTSGDRLGHASERCLSCHLKRTEAEHGTRSRYSGGCRCRACRAANNAELREWHHANAGTCVDCGTQLRSAYSTRCRSCGGKHAAAASLAARLEMSPTKEVRP